MKRCIVILAACGAKAAPAPSNTFAAERGSDLPFQELATEVGDQLGAAVGAWGTAPLADDDEPRRFAVLRSAGSGRGAYLVELAPGQDFAIGFDDDGRTCAWQAPSYRDGDPAPTWTRLDDGTISHEQDYVGGYQMIDFDLEEGRPTALRWEHVDDLGKSDQPVVADYTDRHQALAAMPLFRVVGPAGDAAGLSSAP